MMQTLKHHKRARFHSQKVIDYALDQSANWTVKSSIYSEDQIFRILVLAGINKSSVEDLCGHLQKLSGGYGSSPSADVVMKALDKQYGHLQLDEIERKLSSNMQQVARLLPQFGSRKSKVIVAIDLHDEEYYGDPLVDDQGRQFTMYGQRKNKSGYQPGGKRRVFRYATASIVSWGKRLKNPITIGFAVNYKCQTRFDVLQRVYEQISPLQLKIKYVVIDGGFASVACFRYLEQLGVSYISRGMYSKKSAYPVGQNFAYTMYLSKAIVKRHTVNSFVIQKKFADGSRRGIMYHSSEELNERKIREVYGKRFRIENTYRHARVVKIRTSSRKLYLRWVFWAISLLLELLWEIIRYIFQVLKLAAYSCRQLEINREFKAHILNYLEGAKFGFS